MNIPNGLTFLRIALIPLFVITFYLPFKGHYLVTGFLFSFAAITDWLDGYLARKLQQGSSFGAFLDPVADKLLVMVGLVILVEKEGTVFFSLPALIIIGREITVSALREWMATLGAQKAVSVSNLGKVKTTIQMIALITLLAFPKEPWLMTALGYLLLYTAAILTVSSMLQYLKAASIKTSSGG